MKLTQEFEKVIVLLLGKYGPMGTQCLYAHLMRQAPELCTNRGQEQSYCVWQRDARNALTNLQKQSVIELTPTEGYERRGIYRLLAPQIVS